MKSRSQVFAAALLLAGCASAPTEQPGESPRAGDVGVTDITRFVSSPARIVLAENETFLVAIDDDANAPPAYPDALLAGRLPPRTVCLSVGVAEDGRVVSATPVFQPPACPGADGVEAEFLAAAAQAVMAWRYDPALRCVFPDAKSKADAYGSCNGGREVPQAVSLAYRFVFEQHDGRGSVRMSK